MRIGSADPSAARMTDKRAGRQGVEISRIIGNGQDVELALGSNRRKAGRDRSCRREKCPSASPQASWVRMLKYLISGMRISREASNGSGPPAAPLPPRPKPRPRNGAPGPPAKVNRFTGTVVPVYSSSQMSSMPLPLHGAQEAGGDADRLARFELGFDFLR